MIINALPLSPIIGVIAMFMLMALLWQDYRWSAAFTRTGKNRQTR